MREQLVEAEATRAVNSATQPAEAPAAQPAVIRWCDVSRYENPTEDTAFPMEYAFRLLGQLRGMTVVDLAWGQNSNALVLAALGANVIAIDSAEKDDRAIPVDEGAADRVFCTASRYDIDCRVLARQIRRILKPGGSAVFVARVTGPEWFRKIKSVLPSSESLPTNERVLTPQQIEAASRAVGRPGRKREFMLTSQLLEQIGVRSSAAIERSYEFDAWILNHFGFARALASIWVWEACKER
jgi:hypothetical protein